MKIKKKISLTTILGHFSFYLKLDSIPDGISKSISLLKPHLGNHDFSRDIEKCYCVYFNVFFLSDIISDLEKVFQAKSTKFSIA